MNSVPLKQAMGFLALAALAVGTASCSKETAPSSAPAANPARPNLILVTMEATRADRLGCYDDLQAKTPALDTLAREGAVFTKAVAVAPLTLPSHASILTGVYPPRHGVRDDTGSRLQDAETTLAEHLKALGYKTAASIGARILGADSGFRQGFDSFAAPTTSSRTAAEVVDDAIASIDRMRGGPFFVWVQVDDPRAPYAPPTGLRPPFEKRPYEAELAWMDSQLARLFEHVRAKGLVDNTVVVATADHGESLGEHGEETHGVFLYDSTIRVPLIVRYPPRISAGTEYKGVVSGVDIAPTALALMGVPPMSTAQGESCAVRLLGGEAPERDVAFAESMFGQREYGWAPLYALRSSKEKFVDAPEPELYDVDRDPSETINLAPSSTKDVVEMWRPSIVEALRTIGGPNSTAPPAGTPPKDPKGLVAASNLVLRARLALESGQTGRAVPLLQQALARDPENTAARFLLASQRGDSSRVPNANTSAFVEQWNLGTSYSAQGNLDEAEKAFRAALELNPRSADGWNKLGIVLQKKNQRTEARSAYTRALEASPDHADALFNRAKLELLDNNVPDARRDVDRLIAAHKDYAAASFLDAHVCVAEGNPKGAKAALTRFVALPNADPRMKATATDMLQKLGG